MVDNTDRKRAEETQDLLINELNHRVKNTLAIVQALAHQSLRRTKTAENFVESFSGRLQALARTHTLLSQATWKGAEISKLLRDELLLTGEADGRVDLSGPLMMLAPQQALHMALIFHELATNARKYGALAAAEGSLSVSWSIERDGDQAALHLRWLEKGSPGICRPVQPDSARISYSRFVLPDGGSAFMSCEATGITWDLKFVLKSQIENEIRTPSSGASGRGKKVLIVEDEALIAMELAQAVHSVGG
jgi:two-component sensor histidine kinase